MRRRCRPEGPGGSPRLGHSRPPRAFVPWGRTPPMSPAEAGGTSAGAVQGLRAPAPRLTGLAVTVRPRLGVTVRRDSTCAGGDSAVNVRRYGRRISGSGPAGPAAAAGTTGRHRAALAGIEWPSRPATGCTHTRSYTYPQLRVWLHTYPQLRVQRAVAIPRERGGWGGRVEGEREREREEQIPGSPAGGPQPACRISPRPMPKPRGKTPRKTR